MKGYFVRDKEDLKLYLLHNTVHIILDIIRLLIKDQVSGGLDLTPN